MPEFRQTRRARSISLILGVLSALLALMSMGPTPGASAQAPGFVPFSILESNPTHVIIDMALSRYDVTTRDVDNEGYSALAISGFGHTTEPGKPEVPMRSALIGIPAGASVSLRVLADETRRDRLANPPLPTATQQVERSPGETLGTKSTLAVVPDRSVYGGSALYPSEGARLGDAGTLRSQRYAAIQFYPLQYDPASHQIIFHSHIRVELVLTYAKGSTPAALGSAVDEGPYEAVLSQSIANYQSSREWRTRPEVGAPKREAQAGVYSGESWYRIGIKQTGIYRLTCSQLAGAGLPMATLEPNTLQMFKGGSDAAHELAIRVEGATWKTTCDAGDFVEFYGEALPRQAAEPNDPAPNKYTDTNVYWLTYGVKAGKRMAAPAASVSGTTPTSFTDSIPIEQDLMYRPSVPAYHNPPFETDHWYWAVLEPASGKSSENFTFSLDRFSGGGTASLTYELAPFTPNGHHTRIFINAPDLAHRVADVTWSGDSVRRQTVPVPESLLSPGSNKVIVAEVADLDPHDCIFVNRFDLTYSAAFSATSNGLLFAQTANGSSTYTYLVSGFTTATATAFDVTDPKNVLLFSPLAVDAGVARFDDTISSAHRYAVYGEGNQLADATIEHASGADLMGTAQGADYIVIAYKDYMTDAQRLAAFRQSRGLRVKTVDVQSVYDNFNDGVADPRAIRDYLQLAFATWPAPAPSFVLLVGVGTYDPKGNCSMTPCDDRWPTVIDTHLPAYLQMVDPFLGETATDNAFVDFNVGNPLPAMSIGRLPVTSAAEAKTVVDKILAYEQTSPVDSWRNTMTFIADSAYNEFGNLDAAGNFWSQSEAIASNPLYTPSGFSVNRAYLNVCNPDAYPQCADSRFSFLTTASGAREATLSAINSGSLFVSYWGHGNNYDWSYSDFFNQNDIPSLSGNRNPIMLEMTCLTAWFVFPSYLPLGALNLLRSGGGAVGVWGATGQGIGAGHDLLEKGFLDGVWQGGLRQLGLAADQGKVNLYANGGGSNRDLIDTYVVLGDPALEFALSGTTDDEDAGVKYDSWQGVTDAAASGGALRMSKKPGARITYTFTGSSITWRTIRDFNFGKARVAIDGRSKGTFDGYSGTRQTNVHLVYDGLPDAKHTLTITVTGQKNSKSKGTYIASDAFIVNGTPVEENTVSVQYNKWVGGSATGPYAGTFRKSASKGSTASYTFTGTQITLLAGTGPAYGKAQVLVNGKSEGTIDLYSSDLTWRVPFVIQNLPAGRNTITIKVLGTHRAVSKGSMVVIDGFQ